MSEQLAALVAEATAKSSLLWLWYDGSDRARMVWHVWSDGAAYVVHGGDEQPLPGIEAAATAQVTVRSKDSRARLVTWVAAVEPLVPGDERYDAAAAALVGARLNASGGTPGVLARWARGSGIIRLRPTGEVPEHPGAVDDSDLSAPVAPTPATTRGPLPTVYGRRARRSPKL